jgi:hypothetical protein
MELKYEYLLLFVTHCPREMAQLLFLRLLL